MFDQIRFMTVLALAITALLSACAHDIQAPVVRPAESCGIYIPRNSSLKVKATSIDPASIRNRINQERFDACPYEIEFAIAGASITMDFSSTASFRDYVDASSRNAPLYLGAWQYDGKRWNVDEAVFAISPNRNEIDIERVNGGLLLSAFVRRPGLTSDAKNAHNTCFLLTLLGPDGWAAGIACASSADEIAPLAQAVRAPFQLRPKETPRRSER